MRPLELAAASLRSAYPLTDRISRLETECIADIHSQIIEQPLQGQGRAKSGPINR